MAAVEKSKKRKHSEGKSLKAKPQEARAAEADALPESDLSKKKKKRKHAEAAAAPEAAAVETSPETQTISAPALQEAEAPVKKHKKRKHRAEADSTAVGTDKEVQPAEADRAAAVPDEADELPQKKKKKRKHTQDEVAQDQSASVPLAKASEAVAPAKPAAAAATSTSSFLNGLRALPEQSASTNGSSSGTVDLTAILKAPSSQRPTKLPPLPVDPDRQAIKALASTVRGTQLPAAREDLLKDWSISVGDAVKRAQELGFVLRHGPFSQADDDKIKDCIHTLRRRRALTEGQFASMLVGSAGGGSHRTFRGRCLEEFRYLLMEAIPDRLLKSLQLHARLLVDDTRRLGPFSPAENDHILELHALYGSDWARMGAIMGRAGDDIKHHYRKVLQAERATGPWSADEAQKLYDAHARLFKEGEPVPWTAIAAAVETRTAYQCRDHFEKHPEGKREFDWTKAQTVALLKGLKALKLKDESEIRWAPVLKHPDLVSITTATLAQRHWKRLSAAHIAAHGPPRKLKRLVKALLAEAEALPDEATPRKLRAARKSGRTAADYKSAEYVDDSDEDAEAGEPEVAGA